MRFTAYVAPGHYKFSKPLDIGDVCLVGLKRNHVVCPTCRTQIDGVLDLLQMDVSEETEAFQYDCASCRARVFFRTPGWKRDALNTARYLIACVQVGHEPTCKPASKPYAHQEYTAETPEWQRSMFAGKPGC